jgi:hypothetical protein
MALLETGARLAIAGSMTADGDGAAAGSGMVDRLTSKGTAAGAGAATIAGAAARPTAGTNLGAGSAVGRTE